MTKSVHINFHHVVSSIYFLTVGKFRVFDQHCFFIPGTLTWFPGADVCNCVDVQGVAGEGFLCYSLCANIY